MKNELPLAKHSFSDLPPEADVLEFARKDFPEYEYMECEPGLDIFFNAVWCVNMWKNQQGKLDGYKPLHVETYKNFSYKVIEK